MISMDEKYENFESLWGERHLMAFTIARCLASHASFEILGSVFYFESWCCFKFSNMRGKRTRTLCTRARSTRSTSSTFVTFVQQIDNSSFNRLLKWHFFGINLVYPGGSFWDQPHQGPPGAMEREVAQAHELLDLAKARKWHEARR